jgi:hypothetical protein
MSFEGYYQRLCKNGHYSSTDCYSVSAFDKCTTCFADFVWENLVDETNCETEGFVDLELESTDICPCCGAIREQKYKIPAKN